jgi:hypothetical protein
MLLVREAHGGTALGGAQDGWCAPVAGEPSRMCHEQNDVGGDGRRVKVLLVLEGLATECGADAVSVGAG